MSRSVALLAALSLVATLAMVSPGCAPSSAIKKQRYERDGRVESGKPRKARIHIVRKGENLYRIALRYRTTAAAIMAANGIRNARNVEVGTRLIIPGSRGGVFASASRSKKKKPASSSSTPRSTPRSKPKGVYKPILKWPLHKYTLMSKFGVRGSGKHDGIDLSAPKGTSIMAAKGGKVIFSGNGPSGYGRIVIVKHSETLITLYAHNQRNLVRKGARVTTGQAIATVGNSGRATGYHLHFEVRKNREPVDPLLYLPRR